MLGFSRRETNGFLILLPLIILTIFSQPLATLFFKSDVENFSAESAELDSLVSTWESLQTSNKVTASPSSARPVFLFSFDPNSATLDELHQLGFTGNVASRIVRYRQNGGRFKIKKDLLKIYGIDSVLYGSLYSYINLPENPYKRSDRAEPIRTETSVSKFDLNTADSARLLAAKGVGPILAQRIIKYRNRLGGFVHNKQLKEVYGLDSSAIRSLSEIAFIDPAVPVNKLNLNKAGEKDLSLHPYISKAMAKAIVTYRFQHGNYNSVEDIRNIHALNEGAIARLLPYLSITD